jgi:hypothetical protein
MSKKDYIPGPDKDFDIFQANLSTMVAANAAAWNIPTKALEEIAPYAIRWNNAWAIAKNTGTRSHDEIVEKDLARKDYEAVMRPFVREFLASNSAVTDQQRAAMGLTIPSDTHSPRPKIETVPSVILKAVGGGAIRVECRVEHDSSRASMHPDADVVEISYKIGEPAPANPSETNQIKNSTRGSFIMELGAENAGKHLFCFARWVNESNNSKSGLWSNMFSVHLS